MNIEEFDFVSAASKARGLQKWSGHLEFEILFALIGWLKSDARHGDKSAISALSYVRREIEGFQKGSGK